VGETPTLLDFRPGRELGGVLQGLPPRQRRHPEHVFFDVVVPLLQLPVDRLVILGGLVVAGRVHEKVVFRFLQHRLDFRLPLGERVRDVFEEDQAEHRVLVNGGVEIGAELVGSGPELFIKLAEKGLGGTVRHCGSKAEII
jgi:hypothetical protein